MAGALPRSPSGHGQMIFRDRAGSAQCGQACGLDTDHPAAVRLRGLRAVGRSRRRARALDHGQQRDRGRDVRLARRVHPPRLPARGAGQRQAVGYGARPVLPRHPVSGRPVQLPPGHTYLSRDLTPPGREAPGRVPRSRQPGRPPESTRCVAALPAREEGTRRSYQLARASVLAIVRSTRPGSRRGGRWSIPGTTVSSQPGIRAAASRLAWISGG